MVEGRRPFEAKNKQELISMINNLNKITFRNKISDLWKSFITRMLVKDPSKRITWHEIYEHPLITKKNINSSSSSNENKPNHLLQSCPIPIKRQMDNNIYERWKQRTTTTVSMTTPTVAIDIPRKPRLSNSPYQQQQQQQQYSSKSSSPYHNQPFSAPQLYHNLLENTNSLSTTTTTTHELSSTTINEEENQYIVIEDYMENLIPQ